jgi:acetyl-CoA carboxylase biotin carboxyl carrier protein
MKNGKKTEESVDWKELERLLKLMEQHGLEECEYARGDLRIRLRKPGAAPFVLQAGPAPGANPSPSAAPGRAAGGGASEEGQRTESGREESATGEEAGAVGNSHIVKSPIVGTYFEAPSPEAAPFVQVGDRVRAGQVLCIVEAMKLMNEIEADMGGKLTRAYLQNGQPVEYGQPLFAIQPDG